MHIIPASKNPCRARDCYAWEAFVWDLYDELNEFEVRSANVYMLYIQLNKQRVKVWTLVMAIQPEPI